MKIKHTLTLFCVTLTFTLALLMASCANNTDGGGDTNGGDNNGGGDTNGGDNNGGGDANLPPIEPGNYALSLDNGSDFRFTFEDYTLGNHFAFNISGKQATITLTDTLLSDVTGSTPVYAFIPTTKYAPTEGASLSSVIEEGIDYFSYVAAKITNETVSDNSFGFECKTPGNGENALTAQQLNITCTAFGETIRFKNEISSSAQLLETKLFSFELAKFKSAEEFSAMANAFFKDWNAEAFTSDGKEDINAAIDYLNTLATLYENHAVRIDTAEYYTKPVLTYKADDEPTLHTGPLGMLGFPQTATPEQVKERIGIDTAWNIKEGYSATVIDGVAHRLAGFSSGYLELGIAPYYLSNDVMPNSNAAHAGGDLPEVEGVVYRITNLETSFAFLKETLLEEKFKVPPTAEALTEDGFTIIVKNDTPTNEIVPPFVNIYVVLYNVKAISTLEGADTFTVDMDAFKAAVIEKLTGYAGLRNIPNPNEAGKWLPPTDFSNAINYNDLTPSFIEDDERTPAGQ